MLARFAFLPTSQKEGRKKKERPYLAKAPVKRFAVSAGRQGNTWADSQAFMEASAKQTIWTGMYTYLNSAVLQPMPLAGKYSFFFLPPIGYKHIRASKTFRGRKLTGKPLKLYYSPGKHSNCTTLHAPPSLEKGHTLLLVFIFLFLFSFL